MRPDRTSGPSAPEERRVPVVVDVPDDTGQDVVVRLVGEVDIQDNDLVRAAAAQVVAAGRPVTIDCRDLAFVDSSAFALFVLVLREGRSVTVSGLSPRLRPMFQITGLDRLLRFTPG